MQIILAQLPGFVVGLIGGLIVGSFFHWRAGKQLKKEAKELRRLNKVIMLALEKAGLVKLSRNEKGEITGILQEIISSDTIKLSIEGHASKIKAKGMPDTGE